MIDPALAGQIEALLAQADPSTVPEGVFSWWGRTGFPDGRSQIATLTQGQWQGVYQRLQLAGMWPGCVPPLYAIKGRLTPIRPDGPLPIAIANYELATWKPEFARSVEAAAQSGTGLAEAPSKLSSVIERRRAFFASGLLHDQWGMFEPEFRSRVVTYVVDERFYLTNPGAPLPDEIEVDAGDGRGFRRVRFGERFTGAYPTGDTAHVTVRCRFGGDVLHAQMSVKLSDRPAAPYPDEVWSLRGSLASTGKAYVYRARGHDRVINPAIIAEGFPGGYACDYMYDLMNQAGTFERMRAAGYDMILLQFDHGADLIQNNATVAMACVRKAQQFTSNPLVVGGVSMGGLVTRYALTYMEAYGIPHNASTFLTIDTPHRGAYTNLCDQWFARYFRPASADAQAIALLLDSPANRQFVMSEVRGGQVQESPLRTELMRQLADLGDYPRLPRRLAVACGRGDGRRSVKPDELALRWSGSPFAGATLRTLPEGNKSTIAEGYCFRADPDEPNSLTMSSEYSWEGAPGGQNVYNMLVGGFAGALGYGTVDTPVRVTCSVPTVSALDIDASPFDPVPSPGNGASPFNDYICCEKNQHHLTITQRVGDWLVASLGAPPARSANR